MTASSILSPTAASFAPGYGSSPSRRVVAVEIPTSSDSTPTSGPRPNWLFEVLQQVVRLANREYVEPDGLRHLALWLRTLGIAVPKPFVAIGDDGSIGLEWSRGDEYLYLTFGSEDEAYYQAADGEEWEMTGPLNSLSLEPALRSLAET